MPNPGLSNIDQNSITPPEHNLVSAVKCYHCNITGLVFAKAIYEYEGCNSDELSFPEGAIIRIISKDENGVDDGWWKGELNGKTGVFPALVVEELEQENKVSPVPQQRKKAWTINEHTLVCKYDLF